VFNDLFDRELDARERPERPLPSGRVSLAAARRLGVLLVVVGNAAAALAGWPSLAVAALLTLCIFAYDGWLKGTVLGPVAMGSCRMLNILLGASAVGGFGNIWRLPQLHVAVALGVYIAGVTLFARQEAAVSRRWSLAAAMGVVNLGLALLIAFFANWPADPRVQDAVIAGSPVQQPLGTAIIALGVIGITINRRLTQALFDPAPRNVQTAVKTMLLSHVMLDAAVILHVTGSPFYTFSVIALIVPALLLGRWMTIT
jgi:4-hydroxybenzoate polyprenyltransferase